MKCSLLVMALVAQFASQCFAQTAYSYFTISTSANAYCNFDDSGNCIQAGSNSVNIYTTVVLDGSMTGGTFAHRYVVSNALSTSSGVYGANNSDINAGPTTSAVSIVRNNQIVASADTTVTISLGAQAYCDFVGPYTAFYQFGSILDYDVNVKTTYFRYTSDQVIYGRRFCNYTPSCTNTTDPACPYASVNVPLPNSCPLNWVGSWIAFKNKTDSDWTCTLAVGGPTTSTSGPCGRR